MSGRTLYRALLALCAALLLIDVANLALHVIDHHPKFTIEEVPNFYGFYGLAGGVLLALLAERIGNALTRGEGYYDDDVD